MKEDIGHQKNVKNNNHFRHLSFDYDGVDVVGLTWVFLEIEKNTRKRGLAEVLK